MRGLRGARPEQRWGGERGQKSCCETHREEKSRERHQRSRRLGHPYDPSVLERRERVHLDALRVEVRCKRTAGDDRQKWTAGTRSSRGRSRAAAKGAAPNAHCGASEKEGRGTGPQPRTAPLQHATAVTGRAPTASRGSPAAFTVPHIRIAPPLYAASGLWPRLPFACGSCSSGTENVHSSVPCPIAHACTERSRANKNSKPCNSAAQTDSQYPLSRSRQAAEV